MKQTEPCSVHTKIYAQIVLTTFPPQFPWICAVCLTEGVDRGSELPTIDEYSRLKKEKLRVEGDGHAKCDPRATYDPMTDAHGQLWNKVFGDKQAK